MLFKFHQLNGVLFGTWTAWPFWTVRKIRIGSSAALTALHIRFNEAISKDTRRPRSIYLSIYLIWNVTMSLQMQYPRVTGGDTDHYTNEEGPHGVLGLSAHDSCLR